MCSFTLRRSLTVAVFSGIVATLPLRVDAQSQCLQGLPVCSLPKTGERPGSMVIFDLAMERFMCSNAINAGVLAISRDDTVVYRRAFGWEDEDQSRKLLPNTMMRLASVTKPMTAAAIRKLFPGQSIQSKAFDLDVCTTQNCGAICPGTCTTTGVLPAKNGQEWAPFLEGDDPDGIDARLCCVTIEDLIQHRSGWDNETCALNPPAGQPPPAGFCNPFSVSFFNYVESVGLPRSSTGAARWILGKQLPYDPKVLSPDPCFDGIVGGCYANANYLLLGEIIRHQIVDDNLPYSGYLDYLRKAILDPSPPLPVDRLCVPASEVNQATAAVTNPREPWYHAGGPSDVELFLSYGGLTATAHAIASFTNDYMLFGDDAGERADVGTNAHSGGMLGTSTLARKRDIGGHSYGYAVLLNRGPGHAEQIMGILDCVMDSFNQWGTAPLPAVDCNENYQDDLCEIQEGLLDNNQNGYPDFCEICESSSQCSDGLPCTLDVCYTTWCEHIDACPAGLGCHSVTAQCERFCSVGGGIGGGTWLPCDDGDPCTLDQCLSGVDWPTGVCRYTQTCY